MAADVKAKILLVDDDPIVVENLTELLVGNGYEVSSADETASARNMLAAEPFDLVMTDVSMPTCDGFELLRYVRNEHREVMVILMTGYGTIESAVEAMKQGAHEYLTKPIIDDDVLMAVGRALQQRQLLAENRSLKEALCERQGATSVLTMDSRMTGVMELVEAVADSPTTVLITGESGTGKTLVARSIHLRSPRRSEPFVEVACGALPDTLLESELFGYVRGAFTQADSDRTGKFAAAGNGTIFLDEVATASPQLQVKLLRVLQDRVFEPLGSNETIEVNARVILATNHDLAAEVAAGRFREDLYYRVNVVNIALPPLRDRKGDIPLLAEHFLTNYQIATGKRLRGFTPEARAAMVAYAWPGNVRELENCVERAVVLSSTEIIGLEDLPDTLADGYAAAPAVPPATGAKLSAAMEASEKQIIQAALLANSNSRGKTARQLGIDRTTLYKKMKKYELF